MGKDLPPGIDPGKVPPIDRLDALTDDEVHQVIDWWATENYVNVGAQFWIDELVRRRTARILEDANIVLERIATVTAEDAAHVERMSRLIEAGAEQNAEMVKLNRRMVWLTVANVALALAAVIVALVALAA